MSYITADTEWPATGITDAVKDTVKTYFSLMDDKSPSVGDKLADLFTSDGKISAAHSVTGTEDIRKSRVNAWKVINTRRHEVKKVYTANLQGDDLLLLGRVTMDLTNGRDVTTEFAARFTLDLTDAKKPKLKLYQVWGDSAPLTKALSEA